MLLPRGSRVIVQRLPASKGMGLLDRIAKAELGISSGMPSRVDPRKSAAGSVDHSRFYEIASREDDEEFLSTKKDDEIIVKKDEEEDKSELEKLQNVMDLYKHNNPTSINSSTAIAAASAAASSSSYRPNLMTGVGGGGGRHRYNADPESLLIYHSHYQVISS